MEKRTGHRAALRAKHVAVAVAAAFAPWAHGQTPPPPNTLPTGGVITQGTGTINAPVHAPTLSTLQIDQTSARMAAQFGSFSIGQSAHVNVTQPSSSSVALFKDVGGSLSQIYGGLTANGQIFISNQNGVLFGSTARVEVGSLFATNLSINETDFMEGRYHWYNDGATGTVTNQGTIITPSGYTVLAGPQVRNDGLIIARTGTVVLAAGDRVALDLIGDGLISVNVDQAALNAAAINTGTINADGGSVMLTARSASALLDTVVNSGVIRATALIERNGEIVLDAGPSGTVYATGETQATQVSVRGGGLHVERLVPDPMFLNGMIAGDTINVDVTDAVLVERGGQMTSRFGQRITAGSLTIRGQQPGEFSTVRNESGNQAITVTGADGILVEATNGGGAILGKPFIFGAPATDSQTISATRIQVQGGSIQANEQNITVSGDFSLRNGAASTLGGDQTITVTGGNVDLRGASISSGAAQSITVTGGDHVSVVGEGGFAGLQASFGQQTVSITGTGANAINIDGATVNGLNQTITAGNPGESGSITITGSSHSNGFSHIANIGVGVADPQTVRTSGTLRITGGTARAAGIFQNTPAEQRISAASVVLQGGPSGSGNGAFINSTFGGGQHFDVAGEIRVTGGTGGAAGIFNGTNTPLPGTSTPQTNSAPQTINAGSVVLQGAAGGSGNAAFINSTFGGNQTLTVPGEIRVTGGDGGTGNRAGIITNANQTITGNPNVVLTGGGGSGNSAFIQASGDETKVQVMNARAISLVGGAGADASATLTAVRQNIATTTGDVSLLAGAGLNAGARIGGLGSTLGPTNLTLTLGGDLLLRGGAGDGVSLGSTAASTQANNITVNALSGDVILEAGTGGGARIGASGNAPTVNPGNITVTAGGSLEIGEGTAIRANGPITLTASSLTNDGTISNGGGANTANVILNSNAFDLADGNIQGGAAAVALRPRTGTNSFGIEAAGATTLTNADIASIQTDNFIIFGSSTGTIFTGNMTIGENARVEGNSKNLAFSRSLAPSAEMITIGSQGVATTGDVIMGAGGGGIRSNGGTVTGDEVVLRATNGIGTPTSRVKTAANALALNNAGGGGVFVSELDNVTLRTISLNAGGPFTVSNTNNGSVSLISGGDVNVAGVVSSAGSMILDAGGNLKLDATSVDAELRSFGGQTIGAQSINLTAENGRRAIIQNQGGLQELTARSGGMDLQVAGGAGVAQIVNISSPFFLADQTINVAGQLGVLGGATGGSTNSGIFQNGTGLQTVTAAGITLQGASTGTNAGAGIRSQGDQLIDVSGDINLRGGNGGTTNNAFLSANPTTPGVVGKQTIYAHHINLSNGVGGVDTSATITAGKQLIDVTGNVTLTSQGALLGTAPGGPGVRIGAPGGTTLGTDLTLLVDGNVTLNGGTVAENGASIGSSGAGIPPASNKITIEAGGNVILNAGTASGTGVRIGSGSSGTAGGDISIKAGGTIAMNGGARSAAIRTMDDVSLEAASISQGGNGFILASGLTTKSTAGSTSLLGANQVSSFNGTSSGDLHLANSGPLTVTGMDAAGNASLTNALGDVNLAGRWRSATASIASGGALVQTGAGFIQAGSLTTNSVGANLVGPNQVDVFNGTSAADLVFSNLTQFHLSGVRASGNATLFTAGAMTIGGAVEANVVTLHAGGGRLEEVTGGSIAANTLNAFASGDMTLNGANQIASLNATSFGNVSLSNSGLLSVLGMNAAGDAAIDNFGNLTVGGPWTAGGTSSITAGDILISGQMSSPQGVLNSGTGSITEVGGGAIVANTLSTVSGGSTSLTGPNAVASYDGESGGTLTFNNSGALAITGLDAAGNAAVTNFGDVTLTGAWRSASADIRANGFGSAIREVGAGAIQTGSLTTFSEGATSMTGANQVASFSGATSFGLSSDIALNNTGALTVTGLATGANATLTNDGAVSVTGAWSSFGATRIATTGGDLTVTTNTLRSSGAMDLDVGGRLVVSANGPQAAIVTGLAGQTVRAQGLEVTSQNGGFATLETQGDQRITVTGGSVDVQVLNGFGTAQIVGAPGRSQTIQAVDGDHINVNGRGGFAAIITAPTGTQEVSITGSGANAIRLGSSGAAGFSQIVGGSQYVIAGAEGQSGSITITGTSANGRFAGLSTQPTAGGMQSVSTSGVLRVTGGNAPAQNLNAGLFHGGAGAQTVNAARIELVAGTAGIGNGAMIVSNGGNVPGNTPGAQTITVTGDIVMEGGAGGNANITGGSTRLQKIQAHNISMTNALAGGTDSGAFILGGLQDIHATGNLTMTARGAAGNLPGLRIGGLSGNGSTSTNLKLTLGGDLILTGGTGNNGVGIGTTAAPPAGAVLTNNITIEARDVILNGGTGAAAAVRIGASGAPGAPNFAGDIRITARDIKLNVDAPTGALPAAIRTLGNVTLDAASISEGANGIIVADKLTTSTTGATNLGGSNDIKRFEATSGGPLTLVDAGGLQVLGVATTNHTITLTTDSLTNAGVISNGGDTSTANIVFNADSFNLAGGRVEGGAAAVILRPRTGTNSFGIESAGQTTLSNADIASIHTSDFVVFGSGMGTTFTGNMTIGENARVEGGDKNLAFFRSSVPGGTTTIGAQGVNTTGDVIVSAGGGAIVSNGGTVLGDQVQLRASQGIGSEAARVQTSANRLALNNTGPQGAFVVEAGDVTLGNVNLTVGGIANNVSNTIGTGGSYDVTAGGSLTVSDVVQAGAVTLTTPAGAITEAGAGAIVANDLRTFSGQSTLLGGANQIASFNATSGSDLALNNAGALTVTGLSAGGNATLDNVGNVTVTGPWTAGGTSHITAHSDIVLGSVLTSSDVVLQADGMITEFGMNGVGAVVANTLTTVSDGSTFFSGENRVANYSGTSGADLFFFNRGALNVSHLDAVNANLSNEGTIIISGPWSTSASTTIGASGFEGSLVEAAGGFIQSSGRTDLFAQRSIDLNGPNHITGYLSLFGMQGDVSATNTGDLTTFAGTATFGNLTFVNTGSLNVSGLSAMNASVTNHGPMTISGSWFSMGATSIATEGPGSQLTVTRSVFSNGPMTLNVDGTLSVTASGVQTLPSPPGFPPFPPAPNFATLTSSGGQDITAQSIDVVASGGAQAFINNQGAGNQNITVTGGGINVHSAGGPVVPGTIGSFAQIGNSGAGNQTITALGGGGVQLRSSGGSAQISSGVPGSATTQTIRVIGGSGLDIEAQGGGNASINQTGAGAQRLLVTDADHIRLDGLSGSATVFANGGVQEISITGSGSNAIMVGSVGASGGSQFVAGSQAVSAGSITIIGSDAAARTNGFITLNNPTAPGRTQIVDVTGAITIVGGDAPFQFIPPPPQPPVLTSSNAGIFHNSNGAQTIGAGEITLQGGAGINNGVFINSTAGGNQTVSVAGGSIAITGGAAGTGNRAGIATNANQTINGNPDILLAGGAGGSANNAFIQATGSNSLQAIHARNVQLHAGTGIDASSTLNAARQVISTSGDVSLIGSGGAGTLNGVRIGGLGQTLAPTNLTLDVGGSLLLHGGTASGVSLGSSAASTQSNNITVTAAGNVTLESDGGGARIGTSGQVPVTSGEIVITAGGNVHLGNGTAIRTSGNVSLHADQPGGTISQGANGLILADSLVTSSHGSTSLVGSNQVASFTASSAQGDVHLTNSKPVLTLGSMDLPGNLTVVQTGNLAVGSASAEQSTVVSAADDISMSASGRILVRGSDTIAGAGSAVLAAGELKFSAGSVSLIGGSAPGSFAQITGRAPMDISAGGDVSVMGGSGDGAFARILGYSDINLTVGGFITLAAGSGVDSWARIQTVSRDSVITLNFPNLASGGYFVNGIEGLLRDDLTGFLSGNGVAAPGHQLITIYGSP